MKTFYSYLTGRQIQIALIVQNVNMNFESSEGRQVAGIISYYDTKSSDMCPQEFKDRL